MAKKLSRLEFIEQCNQKHNNKYDYSLITDDVYINADAKYKIICPIHGEFIQSGQVHKKGFGCQECSGKKKYDYNLLMKKFKEIHADRYDYSKFVFSGMNSKIKIICKEHGEFLQHPKNHLSGQGCPKCAGIKPYTFDEFVSECNIIHNNKYDYSKTIYNTYKVKIICSEHVEFEQNPGNHLAGHGCPRCAVENRPANFGYVSSQEIKIRKFLDSIDIQYIANDKQKIFPKELDIFIPEHNLAIEINGIYWHSDKFKDEKYHINKLTDCENAGIQLLQFYDTEIDNKFDIVTSMIRNKLGKTKNKIFARKCEIKKVDKQASKSFQESNHIQGYVPSSIELGLFYNDELVLLTTFGKPRFNKNYEYELLRFCNKLNTSVIGGASKLFSYFLKNYFQRGEKIVSYANIRISDGGLYHKLGFIEKGKTDPNYFYFKSNRIYTRYQCQKSKLPKLLGDEFNSNLTEKENMNNNDYKIVYDCGNYVFEYL